MKTDLGIHVPGVKGLFDSCQEYERRIKLPRDHKLHVNGKIPDFVELRHCRTGTPMGRIAWADAINKTA